MVVSVSRTMLKTFLSGPDMTLLDPDTYKVQRQVIFPCPHLLPLSIQHKMVEHKQDNLKIPLQKRVERRIGDILSLLFYSNSKATGQMLGSPLAPVKLIVLH